MVDVSFVARARYESEPDHVLDERAESDRCRVLVFDAALSARALVRLDADRIAEWRGACDELLAEQRHQVRRDVLIGDRGHLRLERERQRRLDVPAVEVQILGHSPTGVELIGRDASGMLAVDEHAAIQVRRRAGIAHIVRADEGPAAIDHDCFLVQLLAAVEQAHVPAAFDQLPCRLDVGLSLADVERRG